jgi:hypothetical protein
VVMADGKHYGHLTVSDVEGMIEEIKAGSASHIHGSPRVD